MIDLHTHTQFSDGSDNIVEFLENAKKAGLDCISITDHNTVKAYFELETLDVPHYFSGNILTGIELNTKILNIPIEILGYRIDYQKMDALLPSYYLSAKERNKIEFARLCQKCLDAGIQLNQDDLASYDCSGFASKFIHSFITKDPQNRKWIDEEAWSNSNIFYRKYMSNPDTLLYVEMDDIVPDFETASNLIRKCNGLVFIPHIFEYRQNAEKILEYILTHYAIDGIECYYSTFSNEQSNKLLQICQDKNLYISGGSDYHGKNKPAVKMGVGLGNLTIPMDITKPWISQIDFLC